MSTAFGGTGASSSSESFHYGGYNPQASSHPQLLTPQRNPSSGAVAGSSSSFMTSGELYASPSQPGAPSSIRPSSFREPSHARRSMSGGFGFSQYDVSSNQQTATPKNVRFEDASSFPFSNAQQQMSSQQQQQQQQQQRFLGSSSTQQSNPSPYSQSQNAPSNYSQPSYSHPSFQSSLQPQPSFASSTQSSTQPLSMSDLQLTQQRQPSTSLTGSSWAAASSTVTNESKRPSAFTAPRLADLAKPIAVSSSPSRFTATTSSVATQRTSVAQTSSSGTSIANQIKDIVITPRSAITARIRWNMGAFLLAWLVQYIGPTNKAYWLALTTTFHVFGGDADVHLASLLSWLRSAIFVLTFANVVEAVIRLQTGQSDAASSTAVTPAAGQKRKPSLAFPPNRIVSSAASDSANAAQQRPRSEPRHFAQNSPLRETIFRAGISAQQRLASSSSSPLGDGLRFPSQTPSNYGGPNTSGTRLRSSSPAAAYLARRQEQRTVSGTIGLGQDGGGDRTFDPDVSGGAADYSTDSIEVTRAIRALSASYGREMSEVRTSVPSGTGRGSIVAA